MWKSLRTKAIWIGAKPPRPEQLAPPVFTHDRRVGIVRAPLAYKPLPGEEPEIFPVQLWLTVRLRIHKKPIAFPVQFWLAARRLIRNPIGRSIPLRSCIEYFGDDLLRYVPLTTAGLRPIATEHGSGYIMNAAFLDGSAWEHEERDLEETIPFMLAKEIISGVHYRQTKTFQIMNDKASVGKMMNNRLPLNSEKKVVRYCEYVNWLVKSIQDNGLSPRREAAQFHDSSFGDVREPDKEEIEKDIQFAVNKHGEFLRCGAGRHRLSVAHALGIKEVPARLRLVHVDWLKHLTEEYGAPPHAALRKWLGCFRSAVV